jgi:NADPH:quinone reductase-like Zn-dependent oxidoreductase
VKVEYSPINPSDLSGLKGTYNRDSRAELPCLLGREGSGTVVQTGGVYRSSHTRTPLQHSSKNFSHFPFQSVTPNEPTNLQSVFYYISGGVLPWFVSNKRVAFSTSLGVWAEYVVVNAARCVPIPDDITFEQACSCFVNPLTAVAFIDIAKAK